MSMTVSRSQGRACFMLMYPGGVSRMCSCFIYFYFALTTSRGRLSGEMLFIRLRLLASYCILQFPRVTYQVKCGPEVRVDAIRTNGGAGTCQERALGTRQGGSLAIIAE